MKAALMSKRQRDMSVFKCHPERQRRIFPKCFKTVILSASEGSFPWFMREQKILRYAQDDRFDVFGYRLCLPLEGKARRQALLLGSPSGGAVSAVHGGD